jgi:hypothetical protein
LRRKGLRDSPSEELDSKAFSYFLLVAPVA